jgi:hypothetical protein
MCGENERQSIIKWISNNNNNDKNDKGRTRDNLITSLVQIDHSRRERAVLRSTIIKQVTLQSDLNWVTRIST